MNIWWVSTRQDILCAYLQIEKIFSILVNFDVIGIPSGRVVTENNTPNVTLNDFHLYLKDEVTEVISSITTAHKKGTMTWFDSVITPILEYTGSNILMIIIIVSRARVPIVPLAVVFQRVFELERPTMNVGISGYCIK